MTFRFSNYNWLSIWFVTVSGDIRTFFFQKHDHVHFPAPSCRGYGGFSDLYPDDMLTDDGISNMIKFITIFLLFRGFAWCHESEPHSGSLVQEDIIKHNWSLGFFDDRTGLSLIGYTYNLRQTDKNEFFVGGGTALLAFTATMGWKHYYRKSKLSISSVLCGQYVAHLGFMGYLPTISYTLEYRLTKSAQVKFGGMGGMLFGGTSGESGSDVGLLPFIGLNVRR